MQQERQSVKIPRYVSQLKVCLLLSIVLVDSLVVLQGLEGDVYVDSCHEFTCTGPPSGSKGLWVERPAL